MLTVGVVVVVVAVVAALAGQGEAYSSGAPSLRLDQMMDSKCTTGNLRPGHKGPMGTAIFPQTGPKPYTLTATILGPANTAYRPGSRVKVTLTADPGRSFKGFFITGDGEDAKTGLKGTFGPSVSRQAVKLSTFCRDGITHTDGHTPKTTASIIWTAPANFSHGIVQFQATVVESLEKFYTGVLSNIVNADATVVKQSVYAQNQMRQMMGGRGGAAGMFGGMNMQDMMKNMRGMFTQSRAPAQAGGFPQNFMQA